eukprot:9239498-Pyramimonas_sp.AAC.1
MQQVKDSPPHDARLYSLHFYCAIQLGIRPRPWTSHAQAMRLRRCATRSQPRGPELSSSTHPSP